MSKKMTSAFCAAVCLVVAAAFVACEKTEYIYVPRAMVGLTPSTDIVFTSRGGERTIAVRTNQQEWKAESDQEWCKVVPTPSGDGFVVRADPNPAIGPQPRATVTVNTLPGKYPENIAALSFGVDQTGFDLVDLSADGCANCYVVSEAGYYKFDARVQGRSETPTTSLFTGCTVDWVWATDESLLTVEPEVKDGCISFLCSEFKPGNAVVGLVKEGAVVWSWHIWFTGQTLEPRERNMMPVNLGATSDRADEASHFGLFYQWGRKDPFIGSYGTGSYPDKVFEYDEATPFAAGDEAGVSYTAANAVNTELFDGWKVSDTAVSSTHADAAANGTTFFTTAGTLPNAEMRWSPQSDPCPPGWHVPTVYELESYFTTSYCTFSWSDYRGILRGEDRIPAQGYRNWLNGKLGNIGRHGFCWANDARQHDMSGFRYVIGFDEEGFNPGDILVTCGFSVRCARK